VYGPTIINPQTGDSGPVRLSPRPFGKP
jgi:hypothetical protein